MEAGRELTKAAIEDILTMADIGAWRGLVAPFNRGFVAGGI